MPTPSGRVPPPPRKGLPRPLLYAAGAGLLLLMILAFVLGGTSSEPTTASAEPTTSAAPATSEASGAKALEATPAPVIAPEPSSQATGAVEAGATTADPSKSGKTGTKVGAKGAKAKPTATSAPTPSPAPRPAPAPKRKTGPGGIYIPPPDQWFK
jgi:hypothetical protein